MSTILDQRREADYESYLEWLAARRAGMVDDLGEVAMTFVTIGLQPQRFETAVEENSARAEKLESEMVAIALADLMRPIPDLDPALTHAQRDYELAA